MLVRPVAAAQLSAAAAAVGRTGGRVAEAGLLSPAAPWLRRKPTPDGRNRLIIFRRRRASSVVTANSREIYDELMKGAA